MMLEPAAPVHAAPGEEEVLLDQNTVTHELNLPHDCQYLMVGQMKMSQDQQLLAVTMDVTGSESYTLYIRGKSSAAPD